MSRVTFLLPSRQRIEAPVAGSLMSRCLAQGDGADQREGTGAQFARHVDVLPRRLAMAAVSRQVDCGDAQGSSWLRADPVSLRADMTTGRLMAHGDLGLDADAVESLLSPLRPLFGDEGFPISAGRRTPDATSRWYLQLPAETELPEFVDPLDALGADLGDCLPEGAAGRRWRRLFSEAQIVLHNHPFNVQRRDAGLPPVNGLWFWGGGRLPDHLSFAHANVVSHDESLRLLLAFGREATPAIEDFEQAIGRPLEGDWLVDLRRRRDAATVVEAALPAIQRHLADGQVQFDFADGRCVHWRRAHRWRFWRRG